MNELLYQYGPLGIFLVMTWGLMIRKDKKIYELVDLQNKERAELYKNMEALVKEVTSALIYKNVTDDEISRAITELTTKIEQINRRD